VVRGIQLGLGITLGWAGLRMMGSWWLLGLASLAIALFLRENRHLPGALALVLLGLGIMAYRGELNGTLCWGLSLPPLTLPRWGLIWPAMVAAGLAQIPLTLTNAAIGAAALIREYFPQRAVGERKLLLNMGIMNLIAPLFGGMPMCHGAGGLAGQYAFGARTGGASIMEGMIEIGLGLFLSNSIVALFQAFPGAIVGAMMIVAAAELARFSLRVRGWELAFMLLTALLSFATNMALGFVVGLTAYHLWIWFTRRLPHR
jgi:MFS superfamily sulfate permease-like transporter